MKKIYLYSFIAASMLGFASCEPVDSDDHSLGGKLVEASALSFSVVPTENQNEYAYTNTTMGLGSDVRMFWDFADGKAVESIPGQTVTKLYKKAGSYEVKLLAFNSAGQTAVSQVTTVAEDLKDDSFVWKGFGYEKDINLVKGATFNPSTWTADDSWSQIAEPTVTLDGTKSAEVVYSATSGSSQWQSQVHFVSNVVASTSKTYDYSVYIKSTQDIPAATVKVSQDGDDNAIIFLANANVSLKAGEGQVISGVNLPGVDGNVKFTFDFAQSQAGTEIIISDIFLSEHSDDNIAPLDYNSEDNLWKAVDDNAAYTMSFWWADAGWSQIGNPDFEAAGNVYTIKANDGTAAEWQAQSTFMLSSFPVDYAFDFSCLLKATNDSRVTIKFCQSDNDDNTAFYKNDIQLKANQIQAVRFNDCALSAPNTKLVFDFGGCAAGTVFTIGNITIIKK